MKKRASVIFHAEKNKATVIVMKMDRIIHNYGKIIFRTTAMHLARSKVSKRAVISYIDILTVFRNTNSQRSSVLLPCQGSQTMFIY